jgi:hypothetical protein
MREETNEEEFQIYIHLDQGNPSHPGYAHVRTAWDMFTISRSGGNHRYLVQKPMWESFKDLLSKSGSSIKMEDLLKAGLRQVFLGLDYLHIKCEIVHTVKKSAVR